MAEHRFGGDRAAGPAHEVTARYIDSESRGEEARRGGSPNVFATLELRSTQYTGSGSAADYELGTDTTQVRIGAGPVNARLVLDANLPRLNDSPQHLLLEFGDRLGSTAFTIDRATGELVQYTTYGSYGTPESDYRPARWSSFREPYRFTGNEDDMEVGLSYHGARYYSPALHRWLSPDPVTVHSAGADINPYAYGYGRRAKSNGDSTGSSVPLLPAAWVPRSGWASAVH